MSSAIHRPLPSFTLAVSQLCESSIEEYMRDLAQSTSPSPAPPVDLMKTIDCRTDPYGYDSQDDDSDYWRYKNRGSSDYDDDTDYDDDDTDTQTLFDDPLPMTYYATKLERQSPRDSVTSKQSPRRQRAKSMPKLLPSTWKAVLSKVGRRSKSSS
ncbi:hypothetical protein FA13DRAFT_1797043 [Coprinellus micaceus]|uniref:Uncharacterized protein n=1 Tax=Coprinellus micaceus TaxID=71717 RepID=A0A4Y7SS26_COPMI|nr:hypothetical protein FA13DRAFT_1797043 [Coprinellus micaceus]